MAVGVECFCEFCGDPVSSFVQVNGVWTGNPVLYMGRDPQTNLALKFDFCDPECLLHWLAEVLGEEIVG